MIDIKEDRLNKTTFISIDDATPRIRQGLNTALGIMGKENVKHCRQLIRNPPKTGRTYTIGGNRHRASAPGEAPAELSGVLSKSVGFLVSGWDFMRFGYRAPYGKFLEDGTKFMDERPALRMTAEDKSRDNYNEIAHHTGLGFK